MNTTRISIDSLTTIFQSKFAGFKWSQRELKKKLPAALKRNVVSVKVTQEDPYTHVELVHKFRGKQLVHHGFAKRRPTDPIMEDVGLKVAWWNAVNQMLQVGSRKKVIES